MKYILLLLTIVSISFASIGKITAINGEAYAIRGASKVLLKDGSDIEKKDKIKTMPNTKLQIVFNDHTVISLGQKTEFKIDDYIFSKTKVKASFSVSKGIFKSITGKIGKIDHSKFKLKTKNATIGVRGTTFIGVVEDDKETIACTSGEIVVQNDKGMVAVKKGEVTTFRAHEAPKPAKVLDKKFIQIVKSIKPEVNSDNIIISNETIKNVKPILSTINNISKKKQAMEQVTDTASKTVETFVGEAHNTTGSSASETTSSIEQTVEQTTDTINEAMDKFMGGDSQESTTSSQSSSDSSLNMEFGDFANVDMEDSHEHADESVQDTKDEVHSSTDLDELKDKVGGVSNLHYEGKVTGNDILDNNKISLNVDLGHGTISGNVKFTKRYQAGFAHVDEDWNTDLKGDFQGGNRFSLEATSDGYSSENGYTELKGGHLQHAKGSIDLTKDNGFFPDSHADVSFNINGGAVTGQ